MVGRHAGVIMMDSLVVEQAIISTVIICRMASRWIGNKIVKKIGKLVFYMSSTSNVIRRATLTMIVSLSNALTMVKLAIYFMTIGMQCLVLGNLGETRYSYKTLDRQMEELFNSLIAYLLTSFLCVYMHICHYHFMRMSYKTGSEFQSLLYC